jgi:hypothetical protein
MRLGRPSAPSGCVALVLLALSSLACGAVWGQPAEDGRPELCRVGVSIEDLYDFDLARETFGALLWIWSLCPSQLALLETITFRTATPGLELGEVRSAPAGDVGHYQYRRLQGTFRHDWDMRRHPFDRHRLVIPVDENELGAATVIFEADVESSFLSPEIRTELSEWEISDLELQAGISYPPSSYGLPDAERVGYAHLEASVQLKRTQLLAFFKLTAGVFAAWLIALLTFFLDLRDRGSFNSRLGLLMAALFAVLLNLRASDAMLGDASRLTLVTAIHLLALAWIVAIALLSVRERRRADRDLPVAYPNWPLLGATAGSYLLINLGLVTWAAWG